MSYNKNNKYQIKHNKNRYYNAISYPNITNMSINNTETKDKDIIRKCNKKLSTLSLHDNSPNNKSLSNNTKHENKILKVNKQLTYMNRMMHIVNLYKNNNKINKKFLLHLMVLFLLLILQEMMIMISILELRIFLMVIIRLDVLKIKLSLIKTLIEIRLAVKFFYYNDFYLRKKSPHYTFKKWLNN